MYLNARNHLRSHTILGLCILLGTTSNATPTFTPNPNLKVQIVKFNYHNDRFHEATTTGELYIYTHTHNNQQGHFLFEHFNAK